MYNKVQDTQTFWAQEYIDPKRKKRKTRDPNLRELFFAVERVAQKKINILLEVLCLYVEKEGVHTSDN